MSERKLISTGSPFEKVAGYSRAVRVGNMVYVAGTTGYDYETMTLPEDVTEQAVAHPKFPSWAVDDASAAVDSQLAFAAYPTPDEMCWARYSGWILRVMTLSARRWNRSAALSEWVEPDREFRSKDRTHSLGEFTI